MIAFVKKLPDPESFFRLVTECGTERCGKAEADERYARLQSHPDRVVTVYDGDLLVAVGGPKTGSPQDTEFSSDWSATVRAGYDIWNLEANMKKLLGA